MIKLVDICVFGCTNNEIKMEKYSSGVNHLTDKLLNRIVSVLCGLGDLLLPQKPSLRSRHECSGDSGTNDQKTPEICLKSQLTTYLRVQTETRVTTAHHCGRLDYFGTFKVCFFQP